MTVDPEALVAGTAWRDLAARVDAMREVVLAADAADAETARAEGFRYLLRFLSSGLRVCVEHDDPDWPRLGALVEDTSSWGLDNPDCKYSYARLRGDAEYRVSGTLGTARHVELQVNTGHFGDGNVPAFGGGDEWRTISFLTRDDLHGDADGRCEIVCSPHAGPGDRLHLEPDASFLLVRQYFSEWDTEVPASLVIERVGAPYPEPPVDAARVATHFDTLLSWLDAGLASWDRMSRMLLSLPDNSLTMYDPAAGGERRPGMQGQVYGMGPFRCAPDEAVVVELDPPRARMWGAAVSGPMFESLDFATRQTSVNDSQAVVDPDGRVRLVLAHDDPGTANWLDVAGHERGTLALRSLFPDRVPEVLLTVVPRSELDATLPPDTARVAPEERREVIARRHRAVQRRYGH